MLRSSCCTRGIFATTIGPRGKNVLASSVAGSSAIDGRDSWPRSFLSVYASRGVLRR